MLKRMPRIGPPSAPPNRARPITVANVLVSKYADHLPIYRQAQIYSRQGLDLDRSTLADWMGRAAFELRPVHDALMADLKRSTKLFMDETRAPVLDPGARKTKTGTSEPWPAMTGHGGARHHRAWSSPMPPGRGGQHAERILQGFSGILQVDGYARYNRLIAVDRVGPGIQLAYCWAHARRKLIEITRTGPAPIAEEGVALIRDRYAIEAEMRRSDPATRLSVRQDRSATILTRLDDWLVHHRARAAAKSPLGEALAYIAKYRDGLDRLLKDGRVEIDNNTVERTICPIALNRKNALFVGHDAGAENRAVIASLIETCKMNDVDPYAWLSATLIDIVQGRSHSQIADLLPWNYAVTV